MDKIEKEKLEKSIADAEDKLTKGLIIDGEAASQLRRMINYYREKIQKEYKEEE